MIEKIVSGGQTGADQAALDAAIKHGVPHGGWIGDARRTESGPLDSRYQLRIIPGGKYVDRTEKNVEDSDGTLIISHGRLDGGSEYTKDMAIKHHRPWVHIDLNHTCMPDAVQDICLWLKKHNIRTLNVAGPRLSKDALIYDGVFRLMEAVLMEISPHT